MKRWPTKPLSDAYWFQEGPGVRKWQFRNSGVKLLNVANITKEGVLDLSKTDRCLGEDEVSAKYSHFMLDEGDLVIASSGISFDEDGLLRTRGAFVSKLHLPLCLNTSTIRFKAKAGISSLALLRYWLDSPEFRLQITRLVTGSAQQNFGPSHLKATTISLPPLVEQERIVKLLDEADELRKLRTQADRRTAALIPALFHEMFGPKDQSKNDWDVKSLEELTTRVTKGESPGWQGFGYVENGPLFVTSENVLWGELDLSKSKHIPMDFHKKLSRCAIQPNDVLLNLVGASIGRACIFPAGQGDANINQAVAVISCGEKILPEYLLHLFLSTDSQAIFHGGKVEAARANISLGDIRKFKTILPPIKLQKEFAARVSEIREMETAQSASRKRLDDLFNSMLHRAFEGEL